MGVDLRRREAAMTEQFLDCAQIGTAFEQMCRGRVPETVRPEVRCTRDRRSRSWTTRRTVLGSIRPPRRPSNMADPLPDRSQSRPSPY